MRRLVREQLEGERVEAVARQDRGGLVEGAVDGWPAAADVVVVHRRQVVVDQRIDMDAFERGGDARGAGAVDANSRAVAKTSRGRSLLPPRSSRGASPGRAPRGDRPAPGAACRTDGRSRRTPAAAPTGARGWLRPSTPFSRGEGRGSRRRPSASSRIASIRACAASSRAAHCLRSRSPRSYRSIASCSAASPLSSRLTIRSSSLSASSNEARRHRVPLPCRRYAPAIGGLQPSGWGKPSFGRASPLRHPAEVPGSTGRPWEAFKPLVLPARHRGPRHCGRGDGKKVPAPHA